MAISRFTAFGGFLVLGAFAQTAAAQCSPSVSCELVWADEFNGTQVDGSKWEFMLGDGSAFGIPGWGNNELQWYTSSNAAVADGMLTITARDDSPSFDYTSARLRTLNKGDWTYGRFEMRAKLPTGQGMWPAFWMLSSEPTTYGVWAASGEIDIMESLGSNPDHILGTLHYGGSYPDNVYSGSAYNLPSGSAASSFHTYAVEWQPTQIRWYVDGQLYAAQSNWWSSGGPYPAPFDVDFHLLLNLAVGGNLPGNPDGSTVFPQEFVVDYVRVYEITPLPNAGSEVVFDDMEHANPFGAGWFTFGGSVGGGGIDASQSDLPPVNGGSASLAAGYGSGGASGFFGGFGRTNPVDLTGMKQFSFWINPDAGQHYTLEINLQDDDNGSGTISAPFDDEFQYNCVVSPNGPCAVSGAGWQKVTLPLADFFDDNSFLNGGNGVLDAGAGGNGQLISVVLAIIGNTGSDAHFRTDYWAFEDPADMDADGIPDVADNCSEVANADQRDTDGDFFGNLCDADLTNDGTINFLDLGQMKSVFFGSDPHADLDGDGAVNFIDLGLMKLQFFGEPGPSGTAP